MKGVNSSMIYLINCMNLCKCYNVPTSTTIKKRNYFHGKLYLLRDFELISNVRFTFKHLLILKSTLKYSLRKPSSCTSFFFFYLLAKHSNGLNAEFGIQLKILMLGNQIILTQSPEKCLAIITLSLKTRIFLSSNATCW
jgi:hypothetical protein